MTRVVAQHITLRGVEEPQRFCQWLREVALSEGAEGWVSVTEGSVEAWFEGSPAVVDAMLAWCCGHDAAVKAAIEQRTQRPCLRGGFELLDEAPSS